MPPQSTCATCGCVIVMAWRSRRFCSQACFRVRHPAPPPRPTLAVVRSCAYCGAPFRVRPSDIKKGGGRYCSHSCSAKDHTGPRSARWAGGRSAHPLGYVSVSVPGRGPLLEHRVVAEQMLGRRLRRGEEVHHINGVKNDNRPENLEVLTTREHKRRHREAANK